MPFSDLLGRERLHLGVSQGGENKCAGSNAGLGPSLAMSVQKLEVGFHCVAYGEWSALAGGMVSARNHALASLGLRLAIAEDRDPVGVRVIVGAGDGFHIVALPPHVMPHNPLASAGQGLAIAEMNKAGFEGPIVWLAARFEPPSGCSGFQGGIANRSGHSSIPCCPISVQYTRRGARGQLWTALLVAQGFCGFLQYGCGRRWTGTWFDPIHKG